MIYKVFFRFQNNRVKPILKQVFTIQFVTNF